MAKRVIRRPSNYPLPLIGLWQVPVEELPITITCRSPAGAAALRREMHQLRVSLEHYPEEAEQFYLAHSLRDRQLSISEAKLTIKPILQSYLSVETLSEDLKKVFTQVKVKREQERSEEERSKSSSPKTPSLPEINYDELLN